MSNVQNNKKRTLVYQQPTSTRVSSSVQGVGKSTTIKLQKLQEQLSDKLQREANSFLYHTINYQSSNLSNSQVIDSINLVNLLNCIYPTSKIQVVETSFEQVVRSENINCFLRTLVQDFDYQTNLLFTLSGLINRNPRDKLNLTKTIIFLKDIVSYFGTKRDSGLEIREIYISGKEKNRVLGIDFDQEIAKGEGVYKNKFYEDKQDKFLLSLENIPKRDRNWLNQLIEQYTTKESKLKLPKFLKVSSRDLIGELLLRIMENKQRRIEKINEMKYKIKKETAKKVRIEEREKEHRQKGERKRQLQEKLKLLEEREKELDQQEKEMGLLELQNRDQYKQLHFIKMRELELREHELELEEKQFEQELFLQESQLRQTQETEQEQQLKTLEIKRKIEQLEEREKELDLQEKELDQQEKEMSFLELQNRDHYKKSYFARMRELELREHELELEEKQFEQELLLQESQLRQTQETEQEQQLKKLELKGKVEQIQQKEKELDQKQKEMALLELKKQDKLKQLHIIKMTELELKQQELEIQEKHYQQELLLREKQLQQTQETEQEKQLKKLELKEKVEQIQQKEKELDQKQKEMALLELKKQDKLKKMHFIKMKELELQQQELEIQEKRYQQELLLREKQLQSNQGIEQEKQLKKIQFIEKIEQLEEREKELNQKQKEMDLLELKKQEELKQSQFIKMKELELQQQELEIKEKQFQRDFYFRQQKLQMEHQQQMEELNVQEQEIQLQGIKIKKDKINHIEQQELQLINIQGHDQLQNNEIESESEQILNEEEISNKDLRNYAKEKIIGKERSSMNYKINSNINNDDEDDNYIHLENSNNQQQENIKIGNANTKKVDHDHQSESESEFELEFESETKPEPEPILGLETNSEIDDLSSVTFSSDHSLDEEPENSSEHSASNNEFIEYQINRKSIFSSNKKHIKRKLKTPKKEKRVEKIIFRSNLAHVSRSGEENESKSKKKIKISKSNFQSERKHNKNRHNKSNYNEKYKNKQKKYADKKINNRRGRRREKARNKVNTKNYNFKTNYQSPKLKRKDKRKKRIEIINPNKKKYFKSSKLLTFWDNIKKNPTQAAIFEKYLFLNTFDEWANCIKITNHPLEKIISKEQTIFQYALIDAIKYTIIGEYNMNIYIKKKGDEKYYPANMIINKQNIIIRNKRITFLKEDWENYFKIGIPSGNINFFFLIHSKDQFFFIIRTKSQQKQRVLIFLFLIFKMSHGKDYRIGNNEKVDRIDPNYLNSNILPPLLQPKKKKILDNICSYSYWKSQIVKRKITFKQIAKYYYSNLKNKNTNKKFKNTGKGKMYFLCYLLANYQLPFISCIVSLSHQRVSIQITDKNIIKVVPFNPTFLIKKSPKDPKVLQITSKYIFNPNPERNLNKKPNYKDKKTSIYLIVNSLEECELIYQAIKLFSEKFLLQMNNYPLEVSSRGRIGEKERYENKKKWDKRESSMGYKRNKHEYRTDGESGEKRIEETNHREKKKWGRGERVKEQRGKEQRGKEQRGEMKRKNGKEKYTQKEMKKLNEMERQLKHEKKEMEKEKMKNKNLKMKLKFEKKHRDFENFNKSAKMKKNRIQKMDNLSYSSGDEFEKLVDNEFLKLEKSGQFTFTHTNPQINKIYGLQTSSDSDGGMEFNEVLESIVKDEVAYSTDSGESEDGYNFSDDYEIPISDSSSDSSGNGNNVKKRGTFKKKKKGKDNDEDDSEFEIIIESPKKIVKKSKKNIKDKNDEDDNIHDLFYDISQKKITPNIDEKNVYKKDENVNHNDGDEDDDDDDYNDFDDFDGDDDDDDDDDDDNNGDHENELVEDDKNTVKSEEEDEDELDINEYEELEKLKEQYGELEQEVVEVLSSQDDGDDDSSDTLEF
ncbi:auxilin/cyclin g-associated kinase-related [Anaeramoeba flamelloides]|uniref:Auxilin/cyclin g-associated kinase-related n=1 Tax=Anaeramoeba flamelloides TaxID=1746091 RepID=A0ABQ8Y3D8_9EUKA|nr:auxilin/cyclin g-associated kinase-related [Anaeramoeba flamelloides]